MVQGFKIGCSFLFFGSKGGLGDDFRQYDTKPLSYPHFLGQTPLRNSVDMPIPKVPGDQNYLKGCVIC